MTFDKAIQIILKHEGGYVFHPNDLGGETKYGIAKRFYPNLDIKNLTKATAIKIYERDYWWKYSMDIFPDDIRLQMFDMTVNMGFKTAVKVLQRALNKFGYEFTGSGTFGHATRAAMIEVPGSILNYWMGMERLAYYNSIVWTRNSQIVFLKGWTNRAINILMQK